MLYPYSWLFAIVCKEAMMENLETVDSRRSSILYSFELTIQVERTTKPSKVEESSRFARDSRMVSLVSIPLSPAISLVCSCCELSVHCGFLLYEEDVYFFCMLNVLFVTPVRIIRPPPPPFSSWHRATLTLPIPKEDERREWQNFQFRMEQFSTNSVTILDMDDNRNNNIVSDYSQIERFRIIRCRRLLLTFWEFSICLGKM